MYRLYTFRFVTYLLQEEALHACFGCGLHAITTFGGSCERLTFADGLGLFLAVKILSFLMLTIKM